MKAIVLVLLLVAVANCRAPYSAKQQAMRNELIDLIQLNTYVDVRANKASQQEISQVLATCGMTLDIDYLNFLAEVNGFRIETLGIYGTQDRGNENVFDVLRFNELYRPYHPDLKDYFLIGEGGEEWYAWHPADKKYYYVYLYDDQPVEKGKAFENFYSFLDSVVKQHATRTSEKIQTIQKKSLLYITEHITTFLESKGFKKTEGNVLTNSRYAYTREVSNASEWISISIQVNKERNRMSLGMVGRKRYDIIEDLLDPEDIKVTGVTDRNDYTLGIAGIREPDWTDFSEQEVNSPEILTSRVISFLETSMLPALSMYDDVRVLDAKVNETFTSIAPIVVSFYWYHKLIISRLAGSSKYDELFKAIKERFENAVQSKPDEKKYRDLLRITLKLNDQLQKVSPLKDGRLD